MTDTTLIIATAPKSRRTRESVLKRDILGQFVRRRVEAEFGIFEGALSAPGKTTMAVSEARGRAGYVLHTICGLSLTDVGTCLCQHRSSVAKAVARIEADREDPVLDAHLEQLEGAVRPLMATLDRILETGQ